MFDTERFNVKKLNGVEVKEQYQIGLKPWKTLMMMMMMMMMMMWTSMGLGKVSECEM
jgi:hypothetical protein